MIRKRECNWMVKSKKLIKMKNFGLIVVLCAGIVLSACDMEKDPIGLLTPGQVDDNPSESTLTSATNSAYEPLRYTSGFLGGGSWARGLYIRPEWILEDIASGDMKKKWVADGDQAWIDEIGRFTFTADNPGPNGLWTYGYEGISRANFAINKLADPQIIVAAGISENLANRLLAEVLFLRAYYYFELVRNFGDIPLLTEPLQSFEDAFNKAKRVPESEIWAQISADLVQAATLVPDAKYPETGNPWRVSKGAILALQAKVALFSEQWQDVLGKIQQLEALGHYGLNANYFDSFDNAKEYQDNEVIFAYNHTSNTLPRNGNGLMSMLGWGFCAPTDDFLAAFESGDPRLHYTVDPQKQFVYKLMGDLAATTRGNGDSPTNVVFIRWADVLLWKAEAYLETGSYAEAVALINQVRTRARNSDIFGGGKAPAGTLPNRDPQSTDPAQIKGWLVQERRVELGFEHHRFSDLRRWGIAQQVLQAMGTSFRDIHNRYPIPQREIDLSGGSLTQNEGY